MYLFLKMKMKNSRQNVPLVLAGTLYYNTEHAQYNDVKDERFLDQHITAYNTIISQQYLAYILQYKAGGGH